MVQYGKRDGSTIVLHDCICWKMILDGLIYSLTQSNMVQHCSTIVLHDRSWFKMA